MCPGSGRPVQASSAAPVASGTLRTQTQRRAKILSKLRVFAEFKLLIKFNFKLSFAVGFFGKKETRLLNKIFIKCSNQNISCLIMQLFTRSMHIAPLNKC